MLVLGLHNTASRHHRLSLASLYLLLMLMTGACLLHGSTGNFGFAAALVDSGLMPGGVEDDSDPLSQPPAVSALPLFAVPTSKQEADTLRQRHIFSLRLIRAPPRQAV